MNCHECSSLLDDVERIEHDPAARAALEAHAEDCADCAAELLALRALRADPIPDMEPAAAAAKPVRSYRRAQRATVIVGAVAAGATVFAALTYWSDLVRVDTREGPLSALPRLEQESAESAAREAALDRAPSLVPEIAAQERRADREFGEAILTGRDLPDGQLMTLLIKAPVYPPEAVARGIEGHTIVEYAVTEDGRPVDIDVIEASHPMFEQPAIDALTEFRFKPAIVGGRPVEVEGVRYKVGFELGRPTEAAAQAEPDEERPAAATPAQAHRQADEAMERMAEAVSACLASDDLDCIESALDYTVAATEALSSPQQAQIEHIYGYVHYARGNSQRALEAYRREHALRAAEPAHPYYLAEPLKIMARIHYEQHQYQQAFDAAVEYLKTTPAPRLVDYVFVDRLRELGATMQ